MYTLTDVLPAAGNRLLLCLTDGDGDSVTLNISCKTYSDLGIKKGELDEKAASELFEAAEFDKALSKAMNILGYGINSPKQVYMKLSRAGFDKETNAKVFRYLFSSHLINETGDAVRYCETMVKKRYGRKRILAALRQKGYRDSAIEAAENFLSDVDFVSLCAEAIQAKFKELPKDADEMKKAIAKLANLGYNVSEIKSAFRLLTE